MNPWVTIWLKPRQTIRQVVETNPRYLVLPLIMISGALGLLILVIGHSLVELLTPLAETHPVLATLREAAARLDQLYIPTRYPNGLPGGVPAEVFTEEQAAEAIAQASQFLERATALMQ